MLIQHDNKINKLNVDKTLSLFTIKLGNYLLF